MIPVRAHAGQRVCVLRLTEAGRGAARALAAGGAHVTVWDDDDARRAEAEAIGLKVEDHSTRDWSDLSLLIVGDRAMLDEDVSIRAIEMANCLDIEVIDAATFLVRAIEAETATTICAITGNRAKPVAALVRALLKAIGCDVVGPTLDATPRAVGPGTVCLFSFEDASVPVLPDVLAMTSVTAREAMVETLTTMTGPVVLNADDAETARLATRAPTRAILSSGRQSLGGGVFVCAGSVFDGTDGPPRRLSTERASDGVSFTPPDWLAMAYAVLRACEIPFERAREALELFAGAEGLGKPVLRFGAVPVLDYSDATDLRAALTALKAPGPVIWIAGPKLEKGAAALVEASGRTPTAIYLSGDCRKAAPALARLCPTQVVSDVELLTARALFAALKTGARDARIVIAPGCEGGVDPREIAMALTRLIAAVKDSEAV